MSLIRPRFSQLNTVVTTIDDPMTVLNKSGTSANIDVGFIINRDGGASSNLAMIWDQTANNFAFGFTTASGLTNANISIGTYANLRAGSFIGDGSQLTGINTSTDKIFSGNSNVVATSNYVNIAINNSNVISILDDLDTPGYNDTTKGDVRINGTVNITGQAYANSGLAVRGGVEARENNAGSWSTLSSTIPLVARNTGSDTVAFGLYNSAGDNENILLVNYRGNLHINSGSSDFVIVSNRGTIVNVETVSTSTSTGALQVKGGAGIAGNLYAATLYGNIGGGSTLSNVYVTGSLIPTANITYDLGSPTQRWRDGWFSGTTIYIGSEAMSVDENGKWSFTSKGATVELGKEADFNPPSANISGNVTASAFNFANGVSMMSVISSAITDTNTAMKGYVDGHVNSLSSNAAVQAGELANLWANAGAQSSTITTANTNMKGYVDSTITTANTNLKGYVDGQITNLVNGAPATLDTLKELAAALGNDANLSVTITNQIANVNSNITTANTNMKGYIDGQLSSVTANTGVQAGLISSAEANITLANTNMKGYVDGQISTATSAITTANTNLKGYVDAANTIQSNQISGANSAITAANTNMKGYVDGEITTIVSRIDAANSAITTANTNLKGYVDSANTIQSNQIAGANSAITTANTNMKGYVDGQISTTTSAITTANTNMKGYVDAQVSGASGYGNANVAAYLPTYNGNLTTAGIYTDGYFYANGTAVSFSGGSSSYGDSNVAAYLTTNQYAVIGNITTANTNMKGYVDAANTIQSNQISGANSAITTANTNMKGYVDAQITNLVNGAPATLDTLNELAAALGNDANLSVTITNQIANVNSNIGTANTNMKGYVDSIAYSNSSVASYLPSYSGNVASLTVAGNINVVGNLLAKGLKGSDGQLLSATETGLAWVSLGNSPLITDDNGTTVQTNGLFVNVEIDSSNVARFEPSKLTVFGNVYAGTFYGDGSQLTGIAGEYGNVDVGTYLPTYNGNIGNLTLNSSATIFAGNTTANITIGATTWGAEAVNRKITIGGIGQKIYFDGNSSQYSYMDDDEFYIYDGKNNATAYYKANQFALNRNDYTGYFDAGPGTLTIGAYVGNDRSFVANLNMVTWGNSTVRTTIGNTGITTTGNVTAGNVSATNLTGTLLTAAQTNITSVGNLSSLSTSGTVSAIGQVRANSGIASTSTTTGALTVIGGIGVSGNVYTGGIVDITSTAASTSTSTGALIVDGGAGIAGNVNAGNVSATNLTGTLQTAAQPSVTSVGTLTSLAVSNGLAATFAVTANSSTFTDTVNVSTTNKVIRVVNNLQDIHFNANLGTGSYNNLVQARDGGIIFSNGTQGQGNLTIGPWISGTSGIRIVGNTGQVTVPGFLNINSNNNATAIVNGGTNGVGNIGASGAGFNTVFARATSAQYADLAEIYTSDRDYVPGTVLIFGGEQEVTVSTESHDPRVAGVVSTNPAYIMNNSCDGVEVALQGRVPTKVQGPVNKGDRLVTSSTQGAAERLDMTKYQPGCIIGKALEAIADDSIQTIEVVVGRV